MATLALWIPAYLANVTLDGSNNVLTVADETTTYDLTEGTSTNGGVWSDNSYGGYGSILMDGVDDYLKNTGAIANNWTGGNDNDYWAQGLFGSYTAGTSGDGFFAAGDNASANPFTRSTEGTTGSWTHSKRDAATSAGGGSGILNVGTIPSTNFALEVSHTGTAISAFTWIYPQTITTIASGTASDVGTMGTLDNFAVGCVFRTTAASFGAFKWSYLHLTDTPPSATETTSLRSEIAGFLSAPRIYKSRIRTDRHLHARAHNDVRYHRNWVRSPETGVLLPSTSVSLLPSGKKAA